MTKTIIASTKQVEKGYIGVITVLSERQYLPLWYAMTKDVRTSASTAHKDALKLRAIALQG